MPGRQSHTSPSRVHIQYEDERSVKDERALRIKCLEIAANVSRTGDADHISDLARRFWRFVRKGD